MRTEVPKHRRLRAPSSRRRADRLGARALWKESDATAGDPSAAGLTQRTIRRHGVAAISPTDAWAVGNGSGGLSLIEHWNGSNWGLVPNPNPGPLNELFGVAAVSSDDVWAVGLYTVSSPYQQLTLIEHWNGTSWRVVPSPSPSGAFSQLNAVTAVSSNDLWAVGYDSTTSDFTLIEHWNGSNWSIVSSPNQGSDQLNAVAAISSSDVWAVGLSVRHGRWSLMPARSPVPASPGW